MDTKGLHVDLVLHVALATIATSSLYLNRSQKWQQLPALSGRGLGPAYGSIDSVGNKVSQSVVTNTTFATMAQIAVCLLLALWPWACKAVFLVGHQTTADLEQLCAFALCTLAWTTVAFVINRRGSGAPPMIVAAVLMMALGYGLESAITYATGV